MLAFVVALLFVVQQDTTLRPTPAPPAAPPDTSAALADVEDAIERAAEDIERFKVSPIFSPSALYSSSKGFGIGGGIAIDGVASRGDHLELEARVAQYLQGGFGEYRTGNSDVDRLYGLVGIGGWTTSKTRFVGHGPHSAADGELYLDRLAGEAEARLAWSPSGPGGLFLQPAVRLQFDRLRGFEEAREGGLAATQDGDLARLTALRGEDRLGLEFSLAAVRDTRDLRAMPARGSYVQGTVARFQAVDGSGLGFTRLEATGYAFRPALFRISFLPEPGAVFVRASGVVTRQDGDEPLPWIYLPNLDRDLLVGFPRSDFIGRDALSLGVGARGVIGQGFGVFLVEGMAMGMLGAAYDNVFQEFAPRVRLSQERVPVGAGVPLQPSVAVGLNLRFLDRERPLIGALVGIGPGGVSLASLRLIWGVEGFHPYLR